MTTNTMNSVAQLVALRASRPDAYTALLAAASINFTFSIPSKGMSYMGLYAYSTAKRKLLKQFRPDFLNRTYLDIFAPLRSKDSTAFNYLTQRELRRWKKANKVAA